MRTMSFLFPLLCSIHSNAASPLENRLCPLGQVIWPQDSSCYKLYTQGPCSKDEVLIRSLTEVICAKFEDEDGEDKDDMSWKMPSDLSDLSEEEETCLSQEKVFWPPDKKCYSLLSRGPCLQGHWLTLADSASLSVICRPRLCPCDPAAPMLCEVELEDKEGPCKCKVALAAAQEKICEVGEQLLVNPYGFGECGCITNPPHVSWQDGHCYPLYSQGPCNLGQTLVISNSTLQPSCQPEICSPGLVMFGGKCHHLGFQGPCDELKVLELDSETLVPVCNLDTSRIKRVYDIIPSFKGYVTDGPLRNEFKIRDCKTDSSGKCRRKIFVHSQTESRERKENLYIKKRSPRKYLSWLKNYRRKKTRNG